MLATIYSRFQDLQGQLSGGGQDEWKTYASTLVTGALIIGVLISMSVLFLYTGKWIWNNVLVKYISGIKPIEYLYEFFLIVFLIHMIFPQSSNIISINSKDGLTSIV